MALNNSFAEIHPELISEWSEKNLLLTLDNITLGSNKKYGGKVLAVMNGDYDREAIWVKVKRLEKIGYVANSHFTVKGGSMSAGRLYDKIEDKAKGKVVFVVDVGVCRIIYH